MKKKFINGLLLVALFVGFTGSMVSCKDYDDDKIGNLEGILADKDAQLRALLDAQKDALQKQIDALNAALLECKTTCGNFRTQVTDELTNIYITISQLKQFQDNLGNIYYSKTEINEKFATKEEVEALRKKFGDIYTKAEVDALLQQIKDAITAKAMADAVASQLNSGNLALKNALEQFFINNSVINEYLKNNAGLNEAAVKKLINQALVEVNAAINEAKTNAQTALNLAKENQENITKLSKSLTTLQGTVGTLSTTVDKLNGAVTTLQNTVKTMEGTIQNIQTSVTNLEKSVLDLGEKLNTVQTTANEAKALAEANKTKIESLQDSYTILANKVEGVEGDVTAIKAEITTIQTDLSNLSDKLDQTLLDADAKHKEMLQTIAGLAEAIADNTQTIGQLQKDFAAYQEKVADDLDALDKKIDGVMDQVNANKLEVDKQLGLFKNALAQYISGIEINGTHNQLYGEFMLPVGVRSNLLTAFHGQFSTNGAEFPTTDDIFYALPGSSQWNNIDNFDLLMLNDGAYFDASNTPGFISCDYDKEIVARDGKEGNAGTLYMTINPSTTDFTGTEFQLYNSQNKKSDVVLGPIAKSDHLLTVGVSRTETPIGFYEVKATVDEAAVHQLHLNVNLSDLKQLAKDLKNIGKDFKALNTITTLYQTIHNVLPALAAKATWTDDLGETRSVVSQYDLAACAIKPLSFAFGKDLNIRSEIRERVEDFLDNTLTRVFAAFPQIDTENWDIERIEVDEVTADLRAKFHLYFPKRHIISSGPKTVTLNIPDFTLTGTNGEKYTFTMADPVVTVEYDGNDCSVTVEYNIAEIVQHMSNYCSEPIPNIVAELKEFLEGVNDLIQEITSIDTSKMQDNVYKELLDYFDKLADRMGRFFNVNRFMQPIMLVKANEGYARLSESPLYPSKVNGDDLQLIPTTFNAEILSPAYKKFVAVTNVTKGADQAKAGNIACKAILDAANAQDMMKQVIDGGQDEFIKFKGEKGCTYEILYSALDYHGKVSTSKYYVTIAD